MHKRLRRLLPSLSTILIIVGVVCMALGTLTAFQYRPRPLTSSEREALSRGDIVSSEGGASAAPVLLPAPGLPVLEPKGEITDLAAVGGPTTESASAAQSNGQVAKSAAAPAASVAQPAQQPATAASVPAAASPAQVSKPPAAASSSEASAQPAGSASGPAPSSSTTARQPDSAGPASEALSKPVQPPAASAPSTAKSAQPEAAAASSAPASVANPNNSPAAPAPAHPVPGDEAFPWRRDTAPTAVPAPPTPTAAPPIPTSIPAQRPPERIAAPTIGLDSRVVEVGWRTYKQGAQWFSEWETADFAVGFHKLSALPGMIGNTVLSGHNNVRGEVFRNLVDMNVGDPVTLWTEGREYNYLVTDKFIVRETGAPLQQRIANAQWIAASDDERITLVSCWPYWTNTHRVIVVARPVPVAEQFMNKLKPQPADVPTGGADCPARPAPGALAETWQNSDDLRKRLGCAVAPASSVQTTQQFFQGGRMIWRPDAASIAVLYDDGRWQNVASFNGLAVDAAPSARACELEPKLGFGRVWNGLLGARDKLGCPRDGEHGLTTATQMFEGGTALLFANSSTPVLLFRDGTWSVARAQ